MVVYPTLYCVWHLEQRYIIIKSDNNAVIIQFECVKKDDSIIFGRYYDCMHILLNNIH